jgi:hypothetical protein
MGNLRCSAEEEDHVDQQGGGWLEEMRGDRERVDPEAGSLVAGRLLCRPRPGLHPGDQAPANQESISI